MSQIKTFSVNGEDIENEEDESEDETELPYPKLEDAIKEGKGISSSKLKDGKIENGGDMPLFVDADKRGLRTAAYLKVIKRDNPGSGYKGNIPLEATEETIAQMYGDGLYDVQACNSRHMVLRSRENIRISMDSNKPKNDVVGKSIPEVSGTMNATILELVKGNRNEHSKEIDRVQELATQSSKQVIEQGKQYVDMVTTLTTSAAERERTHMAGVQKQQQDFFANMMNNQAQLFQQTMAIMVMSHQHTIESLKAANEKEKNEPMLMVQLLLQGLKLGQDMGGVDDGPDWLKALDKGKEMIGGLATLATFQNKQISSDTSQNSESKPTRNRKVLRQGADKNREDNGSKKLENEPKDSSKESQSSLTSEEIQKLIELKKVLSERGIPLAGLVEEAKSHYETAESPSVTDDSESPENELESP